METIQQTVNGTQNLSPNAGTGTVTISRNGDLLHNVYVTVENSNSIVGGDAIVNDAKLEIGGQQIDRHDFQWAQVWNELSTPESKALGFKAMTGCIGTTGTGGTGVQNVVQIPLLFWFCRNPGLALPLIALQYHEVKIVFTWGTNSGDQTSACNVLADYIYLDTDERRRFAQQSHEYLIEQVQRQTESVQSAQKYKLNFNHPVKELIWTNNSANITSQKAKITLNGHDRLAFQDREYFQLRQPFQHHTAIPRQNLPSAAQLTTLDRQTNLAGIDEAAANDNGLGVTLTSAVPAANGALGGTFTYTAATGLFAMRGGGVAAVANSGLTVGTQIAIVVLGADAGNSFIAADIGKTFFATVLSAAVQGNGAGNGAHASGIVMNISAPTTTDLTPSSVTLDSEAGNDTIRVYRVANATSQQSRTSRNTFHINVYSFALKPEEHQPSGTCNFSRIDTAHLEFSAALGNTGVSPGVAEIFAVNYNVLRIMSGMGGLAYSN
jgi:hypothetical protein